MAMGSRAVVAFLIGLAVHAAAAVQSDADLDARVLALSGQLRCLVCQNQTLADSNAELAVDLRRQIREQLRAGASEDAVKAYLVRRYGDFVLYRPPVKPLTWPLWFGPWVLLAAVVAATVLARMRRQTARVARNDDCDTGASRS